MAELTDLDRAFLALQAKSDPYTKLLKYYDGDQPLTYTASRLKDIFADLDATYCENWCAVVIDAELDRINLAGLKLASGTASAELDEFWKRTELDLESDSVHETALVTGESFVIVWPDPETGKPDAFYNDPRLCHVFYEASNPRRKWCAAKWWLDEQEYCHVTLYYADRLEYYRTKKKGYPDSAKDLSADEEMAPGAIAENPYGEVPVFHFAPQRRVVKSDIKSTVPLQDAINKLLTDMLVSAEFGAFPQRWIISDAKMPGKVANAPNLMLQIPPGDGSGQGASVGQFASTDLGNYLRAIENLATTISAITRTPKHYFFDDAGAQASGEALRALEAPLVRKVQDRIDRFAPVWQAVGAFALKIAGQAVGATDIVAQFDEPATLQPRTDAEILSIRTGAGIPLPAALRMEGMAEEEIAAIVRERAVEQAAEAHRMAASGVAGPGRQVAQQQGEQTGVPIAERLMQKMMTQFAAEARRIVGSQRA